MRKEQLTLDPEQLVFIDETAATTNMTRLYGRAPRGRRLVDKVPHGHWKTTTFICGLRNDGVTAPFVLDGPMDGSYFLAYVEQILAPTLKKGQIVFLDNVSTHKVDGVEEAIEARGARAVFLPAYSPDFNPIEQLFARLKAFLRKMKARTVEELWRQIASSLNEVASFTRRSMRHFARVAPAACTGFSVSYFAQTPPSQKCKFWTIEVAHARKFGAITMRDAIAATR